MSRARFDTFTMVVNFIDKEWMPRHMMIGLFEATATSGTTLVAIVKPLFQKFKLENKVLAYVKDEGKNLNTLAIELTTLVSCEVMGLASPYSGACFGHIMSKVCQHATDDEKVCKSMKKVSMKKAQGTLQKTIT